MDEEKEPTQNGHPFKTMHVHRKINTDVQHDNGNQGNIACREWPNEENAKTFNDERGQGHEMKGTATIEYEVGGHGTSEKILGMNNLRVGSVLKESHY